MKEETIDQVKSLIGDQNFAGLDILAGTISEVAPVISNIITSFKIRRLSKRLALHEKKIQNLSQKLVSIEDDKFVDLLKNFLFPSILQQLLEEDEDNKTGYFLDGFGNVIDKKIIDESRILILYDILKNLRYIEIEYLISLSSKYKRYCRDIKMSTKQQVDKPFDDLKFKSIKIAIESKLEGLGLIDTGRSISYEEVMKNLNDDLKRYTNRIAGTKRIPETKLTSFGQEFLNMYSLLDQFE